MILFLPELRAYRLPGETVSEFIPFDAGVSFDLDIMDRDPVSDPVHSIAVLS